jgi:DNA end-binding protein Ku
MPSKPRWKGTLSLGLVNVPVVLYATAEKRSQAPVGHHVHRTCQTQAQSKKWCPTCAIEIPEHESMRGYDAPAGGFVELTDNEIASVKVESTKTIKIRRVADVRDLEPLMIAETFYLTSDGTVVAAEAEAVLIEALQDKVAVGSLVLNGRERPVGLMVYNGGFLLHVLRTADAMKDLPERPFVPPVNPEMVELAKKLVATMEGPLDLDQTRDAYADGLKGLVAAKAGGQPIEVTPEPVAPKVTALMDALKASLLTAAAPPPAVKAELKPKKAKKTA